MTIIGTDETDESLELNKLKERANKLSEQLRILNTTEDNSSEVSSMVEINDEDEQTIIEIKEENKLVEKHAEADQDLENKPLYEVENIETAPKKQRSFVKLLNKSDLGDSLEEVNNILVGIEQDLANNVEDKKSDDESSNDESSDKTWNPHKPKKAISFCLPEIPPTSECIEQDSPSDDKAVIDDESSYSDDISDKTNEVFTEVTSQKKRIAEKAWLIEKSFGNISKQKYFSNQDTNKKEKDKTEAPRKPENKNFILKNLVNYCRNDLCIVSD